MDGFTEDHLYAFLGKEWFAKADGDTQRVWIEALPLKRLARRWRLHNLPDSEPYSDDHKEAAFRNSKLTNLSQSHTLQVMTDAGFSVVPSKTADLAVELQFPDYKWRWECESAGRMAPEILSKQLIFPLLSLTHLAFTTADPVSEVSASDLEKAIDKVGRTARRIHATHVKQTITRPRVATSIQRMSAFLNNLPEIPRVILSIETDEDMEVVPPRETTPPPRKERDLSPPPAQKTRSYSPMDMPSPVRGTKASPRRDVSPKPPSPRKTASPPPSPPSAMQVDGSATEDESDEAPKEKGKGKGAEVDQASQSLAPRQVATSPSPPPKATSKMNSDSDDSPPRTKRPKTDAARGRGAGVKQPIKRGKRF